MAKRIVWTVIALGAAVVVGMFLRSHHMRVLSMRRSVTIEGAVIERNPDPNKQLPIADAVITATDAVTSATTHSGADGHFRLVLERGVLSGQPVQVTFRHPEYEPSGFAIETGRLITPDKLYIVPLVLIPQQATTAKVKETTVSDVRVRYTLNSRVETNIGSMVKMFQVVNQGNVPCVRHELCSPDKKWKAAKNSVTLDAGADNLYSNVRASCIAGPCPFTHINTSGFVQGGRTITVSATNWSDTATFLLEAEVNRSSISSKVRELYPVIFGRTLNFTLPPTQEGVSLEAELDGTPMVFPFSSDLYLSWATCNVRTEDAKEKTTVYRCELKPGYAF